MLFANCLFSHQVLPIYYFIRFTVKANTTKSPIIYEGPFENRRIKDRKSITLEFITNLGGICKVIDRTGNSVNTLLCFFSCTTLKRARDSRTKCKGFTSHSQIILSLLYEAQICMLFGQTSSSLGEN